MYLDGSSTPELLISYSGSQTIGAQIRVGADFSTHYYFDGSIDDVRIYDRPISIEESQILYAAGAR